MVKIKHTSILFNIFKGLVGAIFEGIGVSAGSFIAGNLFASVGGSLTFRYYGIMSLVFFVIHVVVQKLMAKYSRGSGKDIEVTSNKSEELNMNSGKNTNPNDNPLVNGKVDEDT